MIKIAFIGNAGCGKTTSAKYLEDLYGFAIVSFAGKLKENLESIGVSHNNLYKTKPYLARALMQVYGELMREQDIDYWVNEAMDIIHSLEHDGFDGVLIDDCRFINEAERLSKEGFVLVRLVRDGDPFGLQGELANHASETEQVDIAEDYTIRSGDGDLIDLYGKLDKLVAHIERGEDGEIDLD